MTLNIGDVNRMVVNRKTDIGYMLDLGLEQVFLHNNESLYRELKAGDTVDAFLYFDNKGRLAATLKTPLITINKPGFLRVTDYKEDLGVFFNMGIAKELLLSYEDLPKDRTKWPKIGDCLYVILKVKSKLVAKIASKQEILLRPETTLTLKETVRGFIQRMGKDGLNILTPDGHWIFVHNTMVKDEVRLGEEVEVKLTFHSDKGWTGSLMEQKEVLIIDDSAKIYDYLCDVDVMPYTSDSDPEDIKRVFNMSKKAFKRALGHLYKERKIVFEDNMTKRVKK